MPPPARTANTAAAAKTAPTAPSAPTAPTTPPEAQAADITRAKLPADLRRWFEAKMVGDLCVPNTKARLENYI